MTRWTLVMDFFSVLACLKHLNLNFHYFLLANDFHLKSHQKVSTCYQITAFHHLGTPKWFPCIPFHSAFSVFKNFEKMDRTLLLFFLVLHPSFWPLLLLASSCREQLSTTAPLKHPQSRPLPHNLLRAPLLPSPFSLKFNWDFSKLFSQMQVSTCLGTQSPETLHSSGASENFLSQEAWESTVFIRKTHALQLFWVYLGNNIRSSASHHQTLEKWCVLISFPEITGHVPFPHREVHRLYFSIQFPKDIISYHICFWGTERHVPQASARYSMDWPVFHSTVPNSFPKYRF